MLFRHNLALVVFTLVLITTNDVGAGQPFFMGLAELPPGLFFTNPDDISADGSVVVGWAREANDGGAAGSGRVFRWTRETGMVGIGESSARLIHVSGDGSTIVTGEDWRWTAETGAVPVPLRNVHGASGDGSVLIGLVAAGTTQAARWTEAGGVELIPTGDFYPYGTSGHDISADGSTIVGIGVSQPGRSSPFFWSAADGIVPIDPRDIRIIDDSQHLRISDNGKTVVGIIRDNASNAKRGFRWTKETGAVDLGLLPDGLWMNPTSVSADGSVVVGYSVMEGASFNDLDFKPAIWDAFHGPRFLVDVLVNEYALGEALAGWTLTSARGISADGRTIVGRGRNPVGDVAAWITYLGSAATLAGDFNNDRTVDAADYVVWRKGLASGAYTQADYNTWRANFGQPSGSGSLNGTNAVPEPATLVMMVFAAAGWCRRRGRTP